MKDLEIISLEFHTFILKMRVRRDALSRLKRKYPIDMHRSYGPYSSYWDEWSECMETHLKRIETDTALIENCALQVDEIAELHRVHKQTKKSSQMVIRKMQKLSSELFESMATPMIEDAHEAFMLMRDMASTIAHAEEHDNEPEM